MKRLAVFLAAAANRLDEQFVGDAVHALESLLAWGIFKLTSEKIESLNINEVSNVSLIVVLKTSTDIQYFKCL